MVFYCSAWIKNTDLSPLDPEQCKDVSEKGKSKPLIEAYKVAAENNDLQHYKDILAEHQRMIEEEIQAQEEREAAKAAKKSKGKRKSTAAKDEDEDVDMADSPDVKPKSAKKRKKDVDSDGEGVKVSTAHPLTLALDLPLCAMATGSLGASLGIVRRLITVTRSPRRPPRLAPN